MASWLTPPLQLTGSRAFTCDGFTEEQCEYYMQRWHFWYIADHVYALPTVAFFMTALGLFIISHFVSQTGSFKAPRRTPILRKSIAGLRYLSYRGFRIKALRWISAPLGLLLLALAGTVYFFCMTLIPQPYYWSTLDFGGSPPLGTRAGWMALACMPFVFATATKTNWITLLTGVSHERLQVFHRWTAYAFFVLALIHTFPFIVYHIRFHDMEMQWKMGNLFYWTGIVALIFQAWLTFASHSAFRKLGYEFFKMTHFLAAAVFIVIFFFHCDYTLTSWHYFIATAAIYVPCFGFSWMRTLLEHRFAKRAFLQVEENGFTRITIPVKNLIWTPGQHCFLRFTSFGLQSISSHPFTICSLPPSTRQTNDESELVFYIRHQRGLTEKLYNHALNNPGVSTSVLIDGPYGGINMQQFARAGRLLVIAGGSGAGWLLPFIELFERRTAVLFQQQQEEELQPHEQNEKDKVQTSSDSSSQEGKASSNKPTLRVVLTTRETSSHIWFGQAIGEILRRASPTSTPSAAIDVQTYVTGKADQELDMATSQPAPMPESPDLQANGTRPPRQQQESPHHGRPNLASMIREEAERAADSGESLSVYVCGPDSMLQDVRNAVAAENMRIVKGSSSGEVYLHTEHFSWA